MNAAPDSQLPGTRARAVAWPFVAVIVMMLLISALSVAALSATRAYVAGNSLWARAERETSVLLISYLRTGSAATLAELDAQIGTWSGDRIAREELSRSRPDYARARRGLLAGGNHPDDITTMIWLFRAARLLGVAGEPLRIWQQADARFSGYLTLEQQAIAARNRGPPTVAELNAWVGRTERIHEPLVQLEERFADSMESYARRLGAFLLEFLVASTALLLAAGYIVSERLVRRANAMALALESSRRQVLAEQERAHGLLAVISDAVIATDRQGRIEFLNGAAEELTGWSAREARGQALADVLRLVEPDAAPETAPMRQAIESVLRDGQLRRLTHYGAQLQRRDGSAVFVGERATPVRDRHGAITGMVLVMRDVTAERRLWDELRHQADHDALSGLPNRAHFERCLALLMRGSASEDVRFAVMFVDLDNFKTVNDTCGHLAGDELMRRVGPCIERQLRAGDLLARLGGDEFGVLLAACDGATAVLIAERVRRALQALEFAWSDQRFPIRASIGVVVDERELGGVTDVLAAADRACYAAKKAGRNCVRVYSAAEDSHRWRALHRADDPA